LEVAAPSKIEENGSVAKIDFTGTGCKDEVMELAQDHD
jgi:hypothetical protein